MTSNEKAEAIYQTSYGMTTVLIESGGDVKKLKKDDRDYWIEKLNDLWDIAYKAGQANPKIKFSGEIQYQTAETIKLIQAKTAQEIFDCFEDGVLKTQERIKQRIECEKIVPIQKKYDTWASGLEDGVLELEWLFAWMADNKAKYLKPKK